MRFWGKIKTEDRILRDLVREDTDFSAALIGLCSHLDLGKPIVCDKHINEIRLFGRTVFYPDDFIESVDFDTFEVEIISKRKKK